MKVSVIVTHYMDRTEQAKRSLWLLENQMFSDYEVIVVDDGSSDAFKSSKRIKYIRLRGPGEQPRLVTEPTMEGFEFASGDFIIITHSDILVPVTAIADMLREADFSRRNVPVLYALGLEQQKQLHSVDWQNNLSNIKGLNGFWNVEPREHPVKVYNTDAEGARHHNCFVGQTRELWEQMLVHGRQIDHTVHEYEIGTGNLPHPISLEVYHQWHMRQKVSVRLQNSMGLEGL